MYWVIKVSDSFGNEGLASANRAYEEGETHLLDEVAVCVFSEDSRAQCHMLKIAKDSSCGPDVACVAPLDTNCFKRVA